MNTYDYRKKKLHTYDNCALKETQLTLNGTSNLLSRNGYDGLGRINKVERGLQGGTSVFAYDLMGRLTDAVYGENTTLESNPNRYTERVLEYTANGNIRRFQRHGLKDDGVYGKIDNLHLTYDGNQLKSMLDDALPVIRYATADFADLTDSSTEYSYDECGALISDSNQGILSISYDDLGNPRLTQFSGGEQVEYVYTPSGQKVREIHRTPKGLVIGATLPSPHEMTADTTDYIGPAIYRGGRPEMVRYAGGYASLSRSGTSYVPAFYHYITDYLGNNRAVVRASTGEMVQVTNYYAWGSIYGDMGTGASLQPYKYGDKELDLTAGVARYDYAARAYYAAIPRFDRPDALAGKYPHISPYAFCANNPVNFTDPTGNDWVINSSRDSEDQLNISIKIQGVIINTTNNKYDLNQLSKLVKSQIEEIFSISGTNFSVAASANIKGVSTLEDIKETDHVFAIVGDQVLGKSSVLARSDRNGLLVLISERLVSKTLSGKNRRTFAHELGHTGGLDDTNLDNMLGIKNKDNNLMTQISGLSEGVDSNKAINLEVEQLNHIIRNSNKGELNQRSPIHRAESLSFRFIDTFPFFQFYHKVTFGKSSRKR